MASKLALDPRVDPRIKAVFGTFELPKPTSVGSRPVPFTPSTLASISATYFG